jgi:hypothetical protein
VVHNHWHGVSGLAMAWGCAKGVGHWIYQYKDILECREALTDPLWHFVLCQTQVIKK